MFLALLPFVLQLAPWIAQHVFGSKGEQVTAQVAAAVTAVTGHDTSVAGGIEAAIDDLTMKPAAAAALRQKLTEIAAAAQAEADREADAERADDLSKMKAAMEDTQSARGSEVALAQAHSGLAYGSAILSGIILCAFGTMLYIILTKTIPAAQSQLADILLGTLAGMATQVANFWLGSSSGSQAKNGALASAQLALANSVPMPKAKRE